MEICGPLIKLQKTHCLLPDQKNYSTYELSGVSEIENSKFQERHLSVNVTSHSLSCTSSLRLFMILSQQHRSPELALLNVKLLNFKVFLARAKSAMTAITF